MSGGPKNVWPPACLSSQEMTVQVSYVPLGDFTKTCAFYMILICKKLFIALFLLL